MSKLTKFGAGTVIGFSAVESGPWQALGWVFLFQVLASYFKSNQQAKTREALVAMAEAPHFVRHYQILHDSLINIGLSDDRMRKMSPYQIYEFASDMGLDICLEDLYLQDRLGLLLMQHNGDPEFRKSHLDAVNKVLFDEYGISPIYTLPTWWYTVQQNLEHLERKQEIQARWDFLKWIGIIAGGFVLIVGAIFVGILGAALSDSDN